MKNILIKFKHLIEKYKSKITNMILIFFTTFCILKLRILIPKWIPNNTVLQIIVFIFIITLFTVIIVAIMSNFYKIQYLIEEVKIYGVKGKQYYSYHYLDKLEYPKVYDFKVAGRIMYNAITIRDKFLETGINILNIIKEYIPDANEKLLSNILSYINSYYKKRINKESYYIDKSNNYCRLQVKFENKDTVLFLTISQQYGYGNIERSYDKLQEYNIVTNNNELLHAIKDLNLSSIFLYEIPLPWCPDFEEVKDNEESEELYKLKYYSIEEVFSLIENTGNERWKEYVLNFFKEFDKLSLERAKKFLKLTDYKVPEEWKDILINKKYLDYIKKYIR